MSMTKDREGEQAAERATAKEEGPRRERKRPYAKPAIRRVASAGAVVLGGSPGVGDSGGNPGTENLPV